MALDVAIFDKNKHYLKSVALGVASHYEIIEAARKLNLVLVERMHNYYGDAKYAPHELPNLRAELETLRKSDIELTDLVKKDISAIIELIILAEELKQAVDVIAD